MPRKKKLLSIYHFSDVHDRFKLLKWPKADLYVCSGDATNYGTEQAFMAFNDIMGECLKKKLTKKIYFVPGNHDFGLEEDYDTCSALLSNMEILIDRTVVHHGLKIHGSPWSPTFFNWAFMKLDLELGEKWNLIPDDVEFLITHCPPIRILDQIKNFPYNVGSSTLRQKVDYLMTKNLILHQFGHIHESRGIEHIEDTVFMNASSLCPNFNIFESPFVGRGYLTVIDLETKKIVSLREIY